MNGISFRQFISMSWLDFTTGLHKRRLISRLIWCQRNIQMHQRTIRNEQEAIRLRNTEKINLRTTLRDLGIDPDVVAPQDEEKK